MFLIRETFIKYDNIQTYMCQKTTTHEKEGESDNEKSGQETAEDPDSPNQEPEQETRQDSSLVSQIEELIPERLEPYLGDNTIVEEVGSALVTFSALLAATVLSVTIPLTWSEILEGQAVLLALGVLGIWVGVWAKVKARKSEDSDEDSETLED